MPVVHVSKACSTEHSTSKEISSGSIKVGTPVFGDQSKSTRCITPDALQIFLDGLDALLAEVINAPGALAFFGHEPGIAEELEVPRNCRPTDGELRCELVDGLVAVGEHPKNLTPVLIGQRVKWVASELRVRHSRPSS
jgi:hypothetical protein